MESILTFLVLYSIAVSLYVITVKNSPTNKHVPHFDYKATIIDGMKGIAIGFAIIGVLCYAVNQILTWIRFGF